MVLTKSYSDIPVNIREVLRYAKAPGEDSLPGLQACIKECEKETSMKVCYDVLPITVTEAGVDFGFAYADSALLAKNLSGCESALVFAATAGIRLDRIIEKYNRISPSKALICNSYGAERVESLCDRFCKEIKEESGMGSRPRFSPGYGDLPLDFQREIFRYLSPEKNAGITLNDSLLMSPSKSVTAIMGLFRE